MGPDLAPIEIPLDVLSPEALDGVIINFIEREGTDYGLVEASLEAKKQQIQKQIRNKSIRIVFDPNSESVTLLTDHDWQKWSNAQSPD